MISLTLSYTLDIVFMIVALCGSCVSESLHILGNIWSSLRGTEAHQVPSRVADSGFLYPSNFLTLFQVDSVLFSLFVESHVKYCAPLFKNY